MDVTHASLCCLRCRSTPLNVDDDDAPPRFFRCPRCKRRYFLSPDNGLEYRWGHPVTVVLHGFLLRRHAHTAENVHIAAEAVVSGRPRDIQAKIADELQLELDEPTMKLCGLARSPEYHRDEADCRAFVAAVVVEIRARS